MAVWGRHQHQGGRRCRVTEGRSKMDHWTGSVSWNSSMRATRIGCAGQRAPPGRRSFDGASQLGQHVVETERAASRRRDCSVASERPPTSSAPALERRASSPTAGEGEVRDRLRRRRGLHQVRVGRRAPTNCGWSMPRRGRRSRPRRPRSGRVHQGGVGVGRAVGAQRAEHLGGETVDGGDGRRVELGDARANDRRAVPVARCEVARTGQRTSLSPLEEHTAARSDGSGPVAQLRGGRPREGDHEQLARRIPRSARTAWPAPPACRSCRSPHWLRWPSCLRQRRRGSNGSGLMACLPAVELLGRLLHRGVEVVGESPHPAPGWWVARLRRRVEELLGGDPAKASALPGCCAPRGSPCPPRFTLVLGAAEQLVAEPREEGNGLARAATEAVDDDVSASRASWCGSPGATARLTTLGASPLTACSPPPSATRCREGGGECTRSSQAASFWWCL